MWRGWKITLGAAIALGAVYLYYTEVKPVVIFGLRSEYAHAIPFQKIPEGLSSLKAESCGQCHREIYDEWKTSIHAHAYEDPFFQAYWKKDKNIWVCLNCHTPLENQQPTLVKEIPRGRVEKATQIPNPQYDPEYQKESVTCAVCHVRDGVVSGHSKIPPRHTRRSSIPISGLRRFVNGATMSCQDQPSFITWGLAGLMQNTRASSSCRNGVSFARVATCLRSIGRLRRIARSDVGAGTSGVVGMTQIW
jgi:hypothetical protein